MARYRYDIPAANGKPLIDLPEELKQKIKKYICLPDKVIIESDELIDEMLAKPEVRVIDTITGKVIEPIPIEEFKPYAYSAIICKDEDYVYAFRPAKNWKGVVLIDKGEAGVEDARVIQSGIDVIWQKGGGKILIKSGEYDISNGIRLVDNICFEGEGNSTRLIVTKSKSYSSPYGAGTHPFEAFLRNYDTDNGNKNIIIRNIVVEDIGNVYDARLAQFRGVSNFIIENVTFMNGFLANFEVKIADNGVENKDLVIRNCRFLGNRHTGVDNVHFSHVTNLVFENFRIDGSKDIALDLSQKLDHVVIKNGVIESGESSGIFIEIIKEYVNNVVIDSVLVKDHPNGDGIHIEPGGPCENICINNCQVTRCFRGIRIMGTKNITVSNSIFEYNQWMGIEINGNENIQLVNVISRNNGQGGNYPIGIFINEGRRIRIIGGAIYDDQETHTQQWAMWCVGWSGDPESYIIGTAMYGNSVGAIHGGLGKFGVIKYTLGPQAAEKAWDTFKYIGKSVAVGGSSYGSPTTITSLSGIISNFDMVIHVTAGSGEVITVKVECEWYSGNNTSIIKTLDNSSGTAANSQDFELTLTDKLSLWRHADTLRKIKVYAMSNLDTPTSDARVTVDVFGSG